MKRLLPTKEGRKTEIEIKRFFVLFLNIWKRGVIYRVERVGERADPYPTLTFALKDGDVKWFTYVFCLSVD